MVFVKHASLKLDIFFNQIFIPCFSGSRFFKVQVFQSAGFSGSRFLRVQVFFGPGFSGSRFFWVQVFLGPGFSGSRFFRVQVSQGPGFFGSRFFRVRVQVLVVALINAVEMNFKVFMEANIYEPIIILMPIMC